MKKQPAKTRAGIALATKAKAPAAIGTEESTFREIVGVIQSARARAVQAVNTELIELYGRWANTSAASWKPPRGAKASWINSPATSNDIIPTSKGSRVPACFGCGSFTTPTGARQKSHRWCDKCRGVTICSFWAGANDLRSESFTCNLPCVRNGTDANWNGS